jgi:hypothetical protein
MASRSVRTAATTPRCRRGLLRQPLPHLASAPLRVSPDTSPSFRAPSSGRQDLNLRPPGPQPARTGFADSSPQYLCGFAVGQLLWVALNLVRELFRDFATRATRKVATWPRINALSRRHAAGHELVLEHVGLPPCLVQLTACKHHFMAWNHPVVPFVVFAAHRADAPTVVLGHP